MALLGNSACSVIAILPRGLLMSGLSEAAPVGVCGVALLLLSANVYSDSYISAHRSHLSAIPIQTNLLGASLTDPAIRLHSAACLRNASTGFIGGLIVQDDWRPNA